MTISATTRIAGILLAFGFFFGCSAPNQYIENTKESLAGGDLRSALVAADAAVENNPENATAHYYRGMVYYELAGAEPSAADRQELYEEMRSSFDEAFRIYEERGREGETSDIEQMIRSSWSGEHHTAHDILKDNGGHSRADAEEALIYLRNAMTVAPDSLKSFELATEAYVTTGQNDRAFEILDDAIRRASEVPATARERHAYLALETGHYDEAVASYHELTQQGEENLNLAHGLINALKQTDMHREASQILETLIERSPENPDYQLAYARHIFGLASGKFESWIDIYREEPYSDEAEEAFREARELADEAEQIFLEAEDLAPGAEIMRSSRAVFYQNMAADLHDLQAAISREEFLDVLHQDIDRYAGEAIALYEDLVETSDDPEYYWESLFQLYSFTDQPEKADHARRQFDDI